MRRIEEIIENPHIQVKFPSKDGFSGIYTTYGFTATIVCSTGAGWEHVSISPMRKNYTSTWDDMCRLKEIFWSDAEAVIQIHPAKAEYVNNMPNCLHLWRCTYKDMVLPPSCLVGIRKGQTREELQKEIIEAYKIAGELL